MGHPSMGGRLAAPTASPRAPRRHHVGCAAQKPQASLGLKHPTTVAVRQNLPDALGRARWGWVRLPETDPQPRAPALAARPD
jgi:hypothetical protein